MEDMNIYTFLDKHAAPMIAVFGTLAGVLISQVFNWLMKRREFSNQLKLKKLDYGFEFEKQKLIEPVLSFLESELKLITAIYQKGIDSENSNIKRENLGDHILESSMASARLGVYGNKTLIEKFDEFTRKRIQVGFDIFDENGKNITSAYERIKEAESLASEIILILKEKIENIKT